MIGHQNDNCFHHRGTEDTEDCNGMGFTPRRGWFVAELRKALAVLCVLCASVVKVVAVAQSRTIPVTPGMVITESVKLRPGTYTLSPSDSQPLITIRGTNISVDMRGVRLVGTPVDVTPDQARGTAIRIDGGSNISINGATIRGYRFAIMASGTRNLTLTENDLSHNWKPRLFSLVGHESLVDWMSFHQNEKEEWKRFGAAIYLEDVKGGLIRGNRAEQGMSGLLMTRTDSLTVRENTFAFNSALGIGMYRSSQNVIARNVMDYNVRGYSHGWYRRGQDSAGLLMYEQSSHNIVAWNSVTHSGDGLFLWAGQTTMDTGQGGANDNLYFGNDFSFAPTNGIEATFSRNRFVANVVEGNDHGVWGGYSFSSVITGNCFSRNRVGIAIEHGQDNAITLNSFRGDTTAVYLWANAIEPSDWGYPKHRDTRSRDYSITGNSFGEHGTVFRVLQTSAVDSTANDITPANSSTPANSNTPPNNITTEAQRTQRTAERAGGVGSVVAGRAPACDRRRLRGPAAYDSLAPRIRDVARSRPASPWPRRERSAIVVDEWGPYDWRSPKLWPVDTMRDAVRLRTLGPEGRWRIVGIEGVRGISGNTGRIGDTLVVRPHAEREGDWRVTLEYVGAATTAPNGERTPAGRRVPFSYGRSEPRTDWDVKYFAWTDSLRDPHRAAGNLDAVLAGAPMMTRREARLDYMWYRPRFGLPQERWALDATATVEVPEGEHMIRIISDDAARVWVDGVVVAERREPGGSELMYAPIASGRRDVRVAFYQVGGWTELRVEVVRGTTRSMGSAGPH
jgi:hypothetical protein